MSDQPPPTGGDRPATPPPQDAPKPSDSPGAANPNRGSEPAQSGDAARSGETAAKKAEPPPQTPENRPAQQDPGRASEPRTTGARDNPTTTPEAKPAPGESATARPGAVDPNRTQGAERAAKTGGDSLGSSSDKQTPGPATKEHPNANVWAQHPNEFVPPPQHYVDAMPKDLPRHSSPEKFAPYVNDGGDQVPGRDNNCVDCSRAAQRTWEGNPEVSAARKDPNDAGEMPDRVTDWTGVQPQTHNYAQIQQELQNRGHGASAIVGSNFKAGGGHAFNAVNHEGRVRFVDSQRTGGAVADWPPTKASAGWDESDIEATQVWYLKS